MKEQILITGGAGFIGFNTAQHFLESGKKVIIYDNLSRPGSNSNMKRLQEKYNSDLEFIEGDIRNEDAVKDTLEEYPGIDLTLRLATWILVPSSLNHE